MAHIKFSPKITDARGLLGNIVFSPRYGRPGIRTRRAASNPNTSAQQQTRSAYGRLSELWNSLEQRVRDEWNVQADIFQMSGWNYWIKKNLALERAGSLLVITPPTDLEPVDFWNCYNTPVQPDRIYVEWTDGTVGPDYFIYPVAREIGTNILVSQRTCIRLVSLLNFSLTFLALTTFYQVYLSVHNCSTDHFSESDARLCSTFIP